MTTKKNKTVRVNRERLEQTLVAAAQMRAAFITLTNTVVGRPTREEYHELVAQYDHARRALEGL